MKKKLIFIVGPTASGKTDIALILARQLKAEIISCDAMQVYKEVSILTAKPSGEALKSVKHHLINTVSVRRDFDVAAFRKKTLAAIASVERRGKIPLIVGGSGLYMSILLDGIFEDQGTHRDLAVRERIEKDIKTQGVEAVYARLQEVDPVSAAKIHLHDIRRIVRALEVYTTHGKPISALHQDRCGLWQTHDVDIFAISFARGILYERINARVLDMFRQGVIDEVQKVLKKSVSQTASGIIGLKEIQSFLQGRMTQEQTVEMIQRNTRRYAKRQLTWFRKDTRLTWIEADFHETAESVAKKILRKLRNNG